MAVHNLALTFPASALPVPSCPALAFPVVALPVPSYWTVACPYQAAVPAGSVVVVPVVVPVPAMPLAEPVAAMLAGN